MLVTDKIDVVVGARDCPYYRKIGYDVHKGDKITVDIGELPKSSHAKIVYQCDNCGKMVYTEAHYWNSRTYSELGDYCKECNIKVKLPRAMMDKYGHKNAANVPDIIDKKKRTNLDRYGIEWPIALDAVRDNITATMLDRYGVENAMQLEATKKKARATTLERYGVEFITQSPEFRQKATNTCMERYGVPNVAQVLEFRAKMRQTMCVNGVTFTSKAERAMCDILKDMYGTDNCFPSYPEGVLLLDCMLLVDGYRIDVEYDGNYWHRGEGQRDAARNAVLMNMGYKVLRIKANNRDTMPSKQQIKDAVDYLVKDNHHLVFIDMNE